MPTLFITGTSRGIGLELTRLYAAAGWKVLAACRAPDTATALVALSTEGQVTVERLDVTDDDAVDAVAAKYTGFAIDLLINNAGIYGDRDASMQIGDFRTYRRVMATNAVAPMKVTLALLPSLNLSIGSKILSISSRMGSVGLGSGGSYVYRSSKAALNAAMRNLAMDLKPLGIACAVAHPGWVRTDMGGSGADLTAQESAAGLKAVADGLDIAATGRFFNYDGTEIPW